MGTKKYFIITILALAGFSSFAQEKALELLPGTWVSTTDSTMREMWVPVPEGLEGKSVKINSEGEEEVWEKLRIFYLDETPVYEADVTGNEKPVQFELRSSGKDELLFANPGHDFPKYIHYRWKDKNHLEVEVYAKKGGKKLEFHFRRQE